MKEKLTKEVIVDKIINFMINKVYENCHEEKIQKFYIAKNDDISFCYKFL